MPICDKSRLILLNTTKDGHLKNQPHNFILLEDKKSMLLNSPTLYIIKYIQDNFHNYTLPKHLYKHFKINNTE